MKKIILALAFGFCLLQACTSPVSRAGDAPKINDPKVIGIYPNTPFLFAVPTQGTRPIEWSAEHLPDGLTIDKATGIISGTVGDKANHIVTITAKNKFGKATYELLIKIGDTLALTPPMGWNSWNTFADNISDSLVRQIADSLVATGMRDLGYQFINIDDFWQLVERDEKGHLQIDKTKFPNGIKPLADYIHSLGLKIGIYSDAAEFTCGGVAGSYGYEEIDAQDFADWGIDLLKYDYCHAPEDQKTAINRYSRMSKALRNTNRSIVFSVCEWGLRNPWEWASSVGGSYWRTTWDIRNTWMNDAYDNKNNSIMQILDINSELAEYAGPGHFNDPDMLVVGIPKNPHSMISHGKDYACTPIEHQSHMSLWCLMAAPLLSGNDLRNMTPEAKRILMNSEIIAVNQDRLGKQAVKIIDEGDIEVFAKPLYDGSVAVGLLNRHDSEVKNVAVSYDELGISGEITVLDLWANEEVGTCDESLEMPVKPHECVVVKISQKKNN